MTTKITTQRMLPHEEKYLREFTNAYIEAALWTYNNFPEDRLDEDTLKKMKEDCAKFVKENEDTIDNGWDGYLGLFQNGNVYIFQAVQWLDMISGSLEMAMEPGSGTVTGLSLRLLC